MADELEKVESDRSLGSAKAKIGKKAWWLVIGAIVVIAIIYLLYTLGFLGFV